jgi:hypothetical protein
MEILPRFKIQYPMKNRDKNNPLPVRNNTLFGVFINNRINMG